MESSFRPAVAISHVCQLWRQVILSTPAAWTYLNFRGQEWNSQRTEILLSRSRTSDPLTVNIVGATSSNSGIGEFLSIMERLRSRIETLEVDTVDTEAMVPVLFRLRGVIEYPLLRSLSLTKPIDSTSDPMLDSNALHPVTWSRLERLTLQAIPLSKIHQHFLPNLTSLEINLEDSQSPPATLYLFNLTKMLSATTKLEELSLIMTNPHPVSCQFQLANNGPTEPVLLSNLRKIRWTFRVRYYNDAAQLFSWLVTPALDTLDITFFPNSAHAPNAMLSPYLPFPVRQYLQVQSLSMQWSEAAESSEVLRSFAFPNLKSLHLKRLVAYGPLLPQSTPQLAALFKDPRFPSLESLTLENFALDADDLGEVLRWMPSIKSVNCISCTGVGHIAKMVSGEISEESLGEGRGVKVLQGLDVLTFKGCRDLSISPLSHAVNTRNGVGTTGRATDMTLPLSTSTPSSQRQLLSSGGCTRLYASPITGDPGSNAPQILQILDVRRIEPPPGPFSLVRPYEQITLSDGDQYLHARVGADLEGLVRAREGWRNAVVEVTRSEIDVPAQGGPLTTIMAMRVIREERGRIGQPEGLSMQNPRETTSEVAAEFSRRRGPVSTTPISTVWIQDCELVHEGEIEDLRRLVTHVEYIRS